MDNEHVPESDSIADAAAGPEEIPVTAETTTPEGEMLVPGSSEGGLTPPADGDYPPIFIENSRRPFLVTGPSVTIPRSFYNFLGQLGASLRSLTLPATPPPRFWEVLGSQMLALEELELGQSSGGAQIRSNDNTNWPDPVGNRVVEIDGLKMLTCYPV